MTRKNSLIPAATIEAKIMLLRGQKIMLDSDLARLYGVPTKALNRAVSRNLERFPPDFMFRLTRQEVANLRCQNGTSSSEDRGRQRPGASPSRFQSETLDGGADGRSEGTSGLRFQTEPSSAGYGGRRYLPHAFTEQGVAMLSSVLRSPRAVKVNVEIMRAFVRLRAWLATNAELARKLADLERHYDAQFKAVFDAIRELMTPPQPQRRQIGFGAEMQKKA
jgi:hypothetical protein